MKQVARMDFVGAILVAGAVTNIVLALQWGGNTKPWNDKAVIIVSLSFLTDAQMIFDSVLSVFRSFRCPRRSIHCLGDISWRAGYDPNGRSAFAVNVPFFFLPSVLTLTVRVDMEYWHTAFSLVLPFSSSPM